MKGYLKNKYQTDLLIDKHGWMKTGYYIIFIEYNSNK